MSSLKELIVIIILMIIILPGDSTEAQTSQSTDFDVATNVVIPAVAPLQQLDKDMVKLEISMVLLNTKLNNQFNQLNHESNK